MEADPLRIDVPDSWRADCAVPKGEECATCAWNGRWEDLLLRRTEMKIKRQQLQQSLAANNSLCCAVLLALMDKAEGGNKSVVLFSTLTGLFPRLRLYPEYSDHPRWPFNLAYYTFFTTSADAVSAPGVVCIRPERLPPKNTASKLSMEWAKMQINNCVTNHTRCPGLDTGTLFLPSRLIHIIPDAENEVVLRLRRDITPGAKYVALSHCWGEEKHWPQCLTTAETLEARMHHIAWETIPQTFRDAIILTRRLGLEYIWIDSVCIVQRDEKDWERESIMMESVYSHAFLTLAALTSRNSHGGLFRSRALEMLFQLLTIRWRGVEQPLFAYLPRVLEDTKLYSHLEDPHQDSVEELHPLLTRAWAFQERLVSARTLMFGKGQLLLECCSGRIIEEYWPFKELSTPLSEETYQQTRYQVGHEDNSELERGDADQRRRYDENLDVIRRRYADAISNPAFEDITLLWRDLVEIYSCLNVTKPTDRLPAISAVSRRLQAPRSPDEYICGVWRKSLYKDLLWMIRWIQASNALPISTEEPYIAPSWSWASYPAAVEYNVGFLLPRIELVQNAVKPEYGDSCGRVLPGSYILVRGTVLDVSWLIKAQSDDKGHASGEGVLLRQQWISLPSGQAGKPQVVEFYLDYSNYNNHWHVTSGEVVDVRLLEVAQDSRTGEIRALILHKNPRTGRYRRIGCLRDSVTYIHGRQSYQKFGNEKFTDEEQAVLLNMLPSIMEQRGRMETIALE